MKETVEKILSAEETAKRKLLDAQREASELKNNADIEAATLIKNAKEEASANSRAILEDARIKASELSLQLGKDMADKANKLVANNEASIDEFVDKCIELIARTGLSNV